MGKSMVSGLDFPLNQSIDPMFNGNSGENVPSSGTFMVPRKDDFSTAQLKMFTPKMGKKNVLPKADVNQSVSSFEISWNLEHHILF